MDYISGIQRAITASMPAREKTAVAITGVRIELSDCEKERILLVF